MVAAVLLPTCGADQVHATDLVPYLEDSPPTTQVAVKLCNVFKVVEKPYFVLFGSCWVCAVLQQLIDATRAFEERNEELGFTQKCYVAAQLITLVMETFDLVTKINWFGGESVWRMYNMYVYMFVHSSVFVRSTMMSMIVWDWYEAAYLKRAVFGNDTDGKHFSDDQRAMILVVILQFGSSAFVMALVMITHLMPALALYAWVYLITAFFIINVRSWLRWAGVDPNSPLGRGLVMAGNSFVAVTALQTLITSMTRIYVGGFAMDRYLEPIMDDMSSRSLRTWYQCHLSQGLGAFHDQDFLNLFVR